MSRTAVRHGIELGSRVTLLEDDADHAERQIRDAVKTTQEDIKALRKSIRYANGIGIAILLSLIGALAAVAFK